MMPLLVDETQMRSAMEAAGQRPFLGADPGFASRFAAEFAAMQNYNNSDAEARTRAAAVDDFRTKFYQESGQTLPAWSDHAVKFAYAKKAAQQQFNAWKEKNPQSSLEFPNSMQIQDQADQKALAVRNEAEDQQQRSTGWGSAIGGALGTLVGALTDPVNILAMSASGGTGGVLRTAAVEGAANMASQSLVEAVTYERKKRLDPNYSASEAAYNVAAAGVGGALIGGGVKGLAAAWSRAKTGVWPSAVRDAGNIVQREASVPKSPFSPNVRGDSAYRAGVEKAADDLTRSRPVELPKEVFLEAGARPGRVYDADGNSIGVKYEVVEASDLITSHTDDLTQNPAFPPELQPRDRSRAMSQDQVAGIAGNLQPERLGFSPDASTGAPIVGPDGIVESGNGRVLALRRVYSEEGANAASYRNFLKSQNFEVDGFRNPVLIARRVTDLEGNARVGFVTAANRSTAMRLSAVEQSLSDARLLDGTVLDRLQGPDIKASGNQAFVRDFMAKLPRAEQGALIDKDGFLSQEGERRITAALMGRAYGEPAMLSRALEDTDNNIKAIAGALADSSAPWARLRDAVARGDIPAGMDITNDLMNAVRLVMKSRDEGRAMSDMVTQAEMFGGPDELSKLVARAMFSDADLKKPVGRAKIAAFLNDYATEAMKNEAGPRLIGEPLGSQDILKSSLDRVGRQDLMGMIDERFTPEKVEELAASPQAEEAIVQRAQQLRADTEAPAAKVEQPVPGKVNTARPTPRTIDELYAIAPRLQEQLDATGSAIAKDVGGEWRNPGIKSRETAEAKMTRKGYSDAGRMTDVVRGGFVIDTPEAADKVISSLSEKFDVLDEGWNVTDEGYFDRKVIVTFPDGTKGEIQVWPRELLAAKDAKGHALYREWRTLQKDSPQRAELANKMRAVYREAAQSLSDAWRSNASLGGGGMVPYNSLNFSGEGAPAKNGSGSPSGYLTQDLPSSASRQTAPSLDPLSKTSSGSKSSVTSRSDISGSPSSKNGYDELFVKSGTSGLVKKYPDLTIDLGDGTGPRSLGDIMDEADEEIAAASEIEACATGRDINAG